MFFILTSRQYEITILGGLFWIRKRDFFVGAVFLASVEVAAQASGVESMATANATAASKVQETVSEEAVTSETADSI